MGEWIFDDYENQYVLFAEDPRARFPGNRVCILRVHAGFYKRRQKFFDALGPIAVMVFQLIYPPASE
jgi:hypothetical protein